jgi:hypothetical protein
MATKAIQKLGAIKPYDFDFSNSFPSSDSIDTVTVTVTPTGTVADVPGQALIAGLIVQRAITAVGATVGKEYNVNVAATTFGGKKDYLDVDILVIDN